MRTFDLISADAVCAQLGSRIKRIRLSRNLSQQQLADMAAASLSSVRRLESHGQASMALVVRVAQALQVVAQLDNLFTEDVQTIAQAEHAALVAVRQRARVRKVTR